MRQYIENDFDLLVLLILNFWHIHILHPQFREQKSDFSLRLLA